MKTISVNTALLSLRVARRTSNLFRFGLLTTVTSIASPAIAQTTPGTFNLGQIETVTVTAQQAAPVAMSASTLTNDTIYSYHDTSLNQTLDMMPGVAASDSGGPRQRATHLRPWFRPL